MLDHLHRILTASTIEEVWDLHVESMKSFGFDRLIYGFTRFRTGNGLGNRNDLLVLSNFEPSYVHAFINEGKYLSAPMVKWAVENVGACSWRWMQDHHDTFTPEQLKVIEFNREQGVIAGYTIGFAETSTRSKGAIGLAARAGLSQTDVEEIWARDGLLIHVLNDVVHLKIISLPQSGGSPLTARQREVLEWVADGKTTQDIATIMGVAPATVEKHLRLAREALSVETTAQAVIKASSKNQLFVIERQKDIGNR